METSNLFKHFEPAMSPADPMQVPAEGSWFQTPLGVAEEPLISINWNRLAREWYNSLYQLRESIEPLVLPILCVVWMYVILYLVTFHVIPFLWRKGNEVICSYGRRRMPRCEPFEVLVREYQYDVNGPYHDATLPGGERVRFRMERMEYKPIAEPQSSKIQLEMAIPGSNLKTLGKPPGFLVEFREGLEGSDVTGMGFCALYKGKRVLYTAAHVAQRIATVGFNNFMISCPAKDTMIKMSDLNCSIELVAKRLIRDGATTRLAPLDLAVLHLPEWGMNTLGVTQGKFSRPYTSSRGVMVIGRINNGPLVYSVGAITRGDRMWEIRHKATTSCSFSGSPLIFDNQILGIHLRANTQRKENEGLSLGFLKPVTLRLESEDLMGDGEVRYDDDFQEPDDHVFWDSGDHVTASSKGRRYHNVDVGTLDLEDIQSLKWATTVEDLIGMDFTDMPLGYPELFTTPPTADEDFRQPVNLLLADLPAGIREPTDLEMTSAMVTSPVSHSSSQMDAPVVVSAKPKSQTLPSVPSSAQTMPPSVAISGKMGVQKTRRGKNKKEISPSLTLPSSAQPTSEAKPILVSLPPPSAKRSRKDSRNSSSGSGPKGGPAQKGTASATNLESRVVPPNPQISQELLIELFSNFLKQNPIQLSTLTGGVHHPSPNLGNVPESTPSSTMQ